MHFAYEKDMNFGGSEVECYGLIVQPPPAPTNSHVEALTSTVMVLRDGTFGTQVDFDEIMRVEPS